MIKINVSFNYGYHYRKENKCKNVIINKYLNQIYKVFYLSDPFYNTLYNI